MADEPYKGNREKMMGFWLLIRRSVALS